MSKKKKIIIIISIIIAVLIILGVAFCLIHRKTTNKEVNKLKELPKPEITGGARGELGIDKNINESTIDEYLNREDSVYRDMRMLEDPGNYENIGGDRFLSGYIKGFEVIPLPYIIPVTGLPAEVGDTYTGTTLFHDDNGTYVANYEESMDIIEEIFPKDKVIFLMCGGGGYAGMAKNFLVSLGWNENKIYNVGGYWYYKGQNSVNVKKEVNGVVTYDFDSVPYHNIEFDKLTKSVNYQEPMSTVTEVKINTSQIELEEGTSFKLNAIVLPNEAANKELIWTSENESIATVDEEGLVKAISPGNTTIVVKSVDGNKTASCEVTVIKREANTRIKIDDISKEAEEFNSYDPIKLQKEFDGVEEYYQFGSDIEVNEDELRKYQEKLEQVLDNRASILNRLIDNKKSFVILYHTKECDEKAYSVVDAAENILKQNNIPYLYIHSSTVGPDETIERTQMDVSKITGSIIVMKDGEIYANVNPDIDSISSFEETKNWLSKYIDVN